MNNFYFIFYRCNTIILASQFIIKLNSGHRTGKGQFSFQSQRKVMPKNAQTTAQLDCKEIQPVHFEGNQPWDFFGRNDAKAETPVLWPPHVKS